MLQKDIFIEILAPESGAQAGDVAVGTSRSMGPKRLLLGYIECVYTF